MARANKQEELMNTTYVVVAENGIDTFSMKTVTTRLGVSEGLIYKYFDTREGLLFKSFVAFEAQISELMKNYAKETIEGETLEQRRERIWKGYFNFLLENNYKSLFYFEYRWSYRYADYRKMANSVNSEYYDSMQEFAKAILGHPAKSAMDRENVSWVIENTGFYVKKVLLGDMEKSDEIIHKVYRLIFFGVGALAG